jgi:hypothetical protein
MINQAAPEKSQLLPRRFAGLSHDRRRGDSGRLTVFMIPVGKWSDGTPDSHDENQLAPPFERSLIFVFG